MPRKASKYTTDDLSDVTVFRELEKMKKFIIDECYGKLVASIGFTYGEGEEINEITLTINFNDGTSTSASFDMNTIATITTEMEGEILYLVVTMTNGTIYRAPIDISEMVTISGNQTITGDKLFVGDVQVPDITHSEGEAVQETNEAVNERFLKIQATERIDAIEDEIGDVGQAGTIRGDIATAKTDIETNANAISNINAEIGSVGETGTILDDIDKNKQNIATNTSSIDTINGEIGSETTENTMKYDIAQLQSGKQDLLVSEHNIKTINGVSVLGSGDIPIATGGTWGSIGGSIENQTDLVAKLNEKQDTLVSGTNIKTVGGQSLLGSGNLVSIRKATSFDDLMSATVKMIKIKFCGKGTASSWTTAPSSPTIYVDAVAMILHTQNSGYVMNHITTRMDNCFTGFTFSTGSSTSLGVTPFAFNGGGCVYGTTVYITASNYSTYIDLDNSYVLV